MKNCKHISLFKWLGVTLFPFLLQAGDHTRGTGCTGNLKRPIQAGQAELRLMTCNIWGDYFGNPVEKRALQLEGVFRTYTPDLLGFQEATRNWWESTLFRALSKEYEFVPTEKRADGKPNFTPLFYRRDRFKLLKADFYLFHDWLDGSKGWTCGVFQDKTSGKVFAVFCTHFWWKGDKISEAVRVYNAKDLVNRMKQISAEFNCPAFFMGDLNCFMDSHTWDYLHRQGYKSSFELTGDCSGFSSHHGDPVKDAFGDYHGIISGDPKEKSLDHIGIPENVSVIRQRHVTDQAALDATDHCPVFADVVW